MRSDAVRPPGPPRSSLERPELAELARPWKLATFALAMALLLCGAVFLHVGDWDVGVTLIMGTLTYVTAPSVVRTLARAARERPPGWPLAALVALAVAWLVIDGDYMLYHTLAGNPTYREDNARASTPIYFMAGVFWLYRGSLADLVRDLRALRARRDAGAKAGDGLH